MEVRSTSLPEVLLIEPRVFADSRGFFFESFNKRHLEAAVGRTFDFVQDNDSLSRRGVRWIHYQLSHPQGKLVRVVRGDVFDVAVDLRRGSPRFGKWAGELLSAENKRQLWFPEGFGHGFLVTSDEAEFLYKTTDYWVPEYERCIGWDDPDLGIAWPTNGVPARGLCEGCCGEAPSRGEVVRAVLSREATLSRRKPDSLISDSRSAGSPRNHVGHYEEVQG